MMEFCGELEKPLEIKVPTLLIQLHHNVGQNIMKTIGKPYEIKLFTHDDDDCFYSAAGQNITEIIGIR